MSCLKLPQQPLCIRQLAPRQPCFLPTHLIFLALPHPSFVNDLFHLPFVQHHGDDLESRIRTYRLSPQTSSGKVSRPRINSAKKETLIKASFPISLLSNRRRSCQTGCYNNPRPTTIHISSSRRSSRRVSITISISNISSSNSINITVIKGITWPSRARSSREVW